MSKDALEAEHARTEELEGSEAILKLQGKSERQILELKIKQYKREIEKGEVQIQNEKNTLKGQIAASERNKEIVKMIARGAMEMATYIV